MKARIQVLRQATMNLIRSEKSTKKGQSTHDDICRLCRRDRLAHDTAPGLPSAKVFVERWLVDPQLRHFLPINLDPWLDPPSLALLPSSAGFFSAADHTRLFLMCRSAAREID